MEVFELKLDNVYVNLQSLEEYILEINTTIGNTIIVELRSEIACFGNEFGIDYLKHQDLFAYCSSIEKFILTMNNLLKNKGVVL